MKNIQIIDNFIDQTYQNLLEETLFGLNFPWYYNKNTSYQDTEINQKWMSNDNRLKDTDVFLHNFLKDGITSSFFETIKPLLQNLKAKEFYRVRGVFVHKNPNFGNFINIPHVDIPIPHWTAIYYVNDSDGDTVIFKEKLDNSNPYDKKTIEQTISPKKGRILLFDGLKYHTGSVPINNHRALININFNYEMHQ